MSSESEQELLDEINYLTGLIKSHQNTSRSEDVATYTSGQSSGQVQWSSRGVSKPKSKVIVSQARSTQKPAPTTTCNLHKQHPSKERSERTRQGNLVYRPGEAAQSGGANVSIKPKDASSSISHMRRSKSTVGRTKSKFVYYGNSQQDSYGGISTCMSRQKMATATIKNKSLSVVGDGTGSASLSSCRPVVQSNTGSKLPAPSLSIPSSSAQSLSFKDEIHRTRKRKKSTSRSGDGKTQPPTKRHKHIPESGLKSGKYVWTAQNLSHKTSPKLSPLSQLPKRSQLRWKRKSLTKKVMASAQSPSTPTVGSKSPVTKKTPKMTAVSRYKWRRRLSSSGSKKLSVLRAPNPTLVIQSKYKMTHASLLRKYPMWSPRSGSFTHRRLNYLSKRSQAASVHRPTSSKALRMKPTKSKNRVWVSDSRSASDTELPPSVVSGTHSMSVASLKLVGCEGRTKCGNKQWVAGSMQGVSVGAGLQSKSPGQRARRRLVSLRGHKFLVDSSGKRLQRLPSTPAPSGSISDASKAYSAARLLASRAIRRSKAFVWHAKQRSKQPKTQQYCTFFNRFGKCNRGDTCPYIHDPNRVALCTKFLRGICDKTDGTCPFSHKISKEKMPVCSFFLRGICMRDACPYLHVSVGRDAEMCPDFLTGYCPRGEQCKKLHTLDCPDFSKTGSCPRGKACPLRHQKRKPSGMSRTEADQSPAAVKEPLAFKRVRYKQSFQKPLLSSPVHNSDSKVITPAQLDFIPLEQDDAPDFIALQ